MELRLWYTSNYMELRDIEELIVVQLIKYFPVLYGARKFITAFTRAFHWTLF
jgi:hypothetical protein